MDLSLLGVFGAGVATFLTPCVLPLVPIYLAALAGGSLDRVAQGGRGQLLGRAALFSVGFIAVFSALGLGASSIGAVLNEHKLLLQGLGAILILVFGLKFLGLISIPFLDRVAKADDTRFQTRFGSVNALVMGVVFAAGWTPCVGPVLGSVLSYTAAATSNPWAGAAYLGIYGLGFALPLIGTALFAEAGVRFLDRIKPHLPRIERVIGVLLVIVAASLVWDIAKGIKGTPQGAANPTELTTDARGERVPAMVELYTKDCVICKEMKPLVAELTAQCHGKNVLVRTVDVSAPRNAGLDRQFRLVGVPTFLFLDKDGNETARLVGRQSREALLQALSVLRGESCPGVGALPGASTNEQLVAPNRAPATPGTKTQGEEDESCPSTSTGAITAPRNSNPYSPSGTATGRAVLAVESEPSACSRGSL